MSPQTNGFVLMQRRKKDPSSTQSRSVSVCLIIHYYEPSLAFKTTLRRVVHVSHVSGGGRLLNSLRAQSLRGGEREDTPGTLLLMRIAVNTRVPLSLH